MCDYELAGAFVLVSNPIPRQVEIKTNSRTLRVIWSDQHGSDYPFRYLRGFCPCAGCQGHRAGPKTFVPTQDPMVDEVMLVGRYAVTPVWKDGHNTGIYSFDYLRALCPCSTCKPEGIAPEFC